MPLFFAMFFFFFFAAAHAARPAPCRASAVDDAYAIYTILLIALMRCAAWRSAGERRSDTAPIYAVDDAAALMPPAFDTARHDAPLPVYAMFARRP